MVTSRAPRISTGTRLPHPTSPLRTGRTLSFSQVWATSQSANQLFTALASLQTAAVNDTVIVLQYTQGQSNDAQLLNTAQPDTQNRIVSSILADAQVTETNMIDVLVTGQVAPTPAVQAAFAAATTPIPTKTSVQNLNTTTVAPPASPISSSPTQDSSELPQYKGPAI
jgi:hypothetical protein